MSVASPCGRCGRTLLDLRRDASREALRGSAPLCAVPACPLVQRVLGFRGAPPAMPSGLEIHGPSPPAVFVGRFGYPRVTVGPLLPSVGPDEAAEEQAWGGGSAVGGATGGGAAGAAAAGGGGGLGASLADEPAEWARKLGIADILAMRARLFRSKHSVTVDARVVPHALEASREVAMSARPVDTEVTLAKPLRAPRLEPKIDLTAQPMGPSVDVVDARVLSHPSVPRRVDALVGDVHADAATGVHELYDGGISAYHIQRLLSVGLLGRAQRRKLVPTRWSITATDDILGKQLIEEVKSLGVLDAPRVFSSDLFGNYFEVLLLPRIWAFEMIEAWFEDGAWGAGHDWEGHAGRTSYADSITGAYYAARLSVLEHLVEKRVQATAFVYREITDEYWAPLGVWVIREAVKTAMEGRGLVFGDVESALRHMVRRSRWKDWLRLAKLPKEARVQKTLREYADDDGGA